MYPEIGSAHIHLNFEVIESRDAFCMLRQTLPQIFPWHFGICIQVVCSALAAAQEVTRVERVIHVPSNSYRRIYSETYHQCRNQVLQTTLDSKTGQATYLALGRRSMSNGIQSNETCSKLITDIGYFPLFLPFPPAKNAGMALRQPTKADEHFINQSKDRCLA